MKRFSILTILTATLLAVAPLAVAEDASFDSDGVQIHYQVEGEGEPVVLIHGFTASTATNWIAPGIFQALAKDYRVIGIDMRGHGKSGKPHGKENYGAKMPKDVINLLDELGIAKAHIIGYSMGGFITTNIVCNYPDRVISAISGGAGWMRPGGMVSDGRNAIAESLENGSGLGPLFAALTPEGAPAMPAEQLEAINRMLMATNDPLALAGVIRGMDGLEVTEAQLKANRVPTRAIVGEIDPLREGVTAMEKVMSALDVVVVDGADHMTAFGNPAFLKAARQHLEANGLDKQTKQETGELVSAGSGR
ncbi:MAG: alpha/beta hydrolase [Candidatus Hydrogenedentes bacterium]|nr:alpha/beta hydrolase [Candidatus Hydrogenedentota bacterium]